jgi:hypothetical protein
MEIVGDVTAVLSLIASVSPTSFRRPLARGAAV